jgi:hypothetical protein
MNRAGTQLVVALAIIMCAKSAGAVERETCVNSAETAQELRKQNKLRSARDQLNVCSQHSCPSVIRKDCTAWLAEVGKLIPTLKLEARDPDGKPLLDVRVIVDNTIVAQQLSDPPNPVEVDPGQHIVRFERTGSTPAEQAVTVAAGEATRTVRVDLAPLAKPDDKARDRHATSDTRAPTPLATYVFGGVGIVALASFAGFAVKGSSDYSDLVQSCRPHCTSDQTSPVSTEFLVANVSLAVAAVSLGAAAYFYFTRASADATVRRAAMGVSPLRGGAMAGFDLAF